MPVYKLLDEMPYEELMDWFEYFDRRPEGWREDDRAAKIIQAQGVKAKSKELFPSLAKIYEPDDKYVDRLTASVKGSWIHGMMQNAVGGDKLDFL